VKPNLGAALAAADTSTAAWVVRGVAAAAGGDSAAARKALAAARRKPSAERRRFETDIKLLEGWTEAMAGRWDEVVSLLDSPMTAGQGPWFTGRLPIRWLVATAQEKRGLLEQAAQAYELVLSPERLHHDVWTWRAALLPFAHQRLAILYMKLGKAPEAEKHAKALREVWADPDPALRPLLDEVRSAIEAGV
jgi:tetratricopeptide (TPR) repeat protein